MKLAVIGQSVTAVKFLEQFRSQHNDAEITIIAFDENLPALSERFPELIARQIARADVIFHDEKFYQNRRMEIISDKNISRINFNKRIIFFDDKSRLEADIIIIADAEKDQFPDIKGTGRDGIFSLRTYAQIDKFLNSINHVDTIMFQSSSLRGISLAQALAAQDKEVIFCLPSERIWGEKLDQVSSDFVISLLQNTGVRVLRNTHISELLGETDVKAARLSTGKVLAAEIVIFPDAFPDMRLYVKSDFNVGQQIKTDQLLRANDGGVFAIDDMAQSVSDAMKACDAEQYRNDQVARLEAAVNNAEYNAIDDKKFTFEVSGRNITVIGNLNDSDAEVFIKKDENGFLQKRILVKNSVVQGAFLIDNNNDIDGLARIINEQQVIEAQEAELLSDCVKESEVADFSQPTEVDEFVDGEEACEFSDPSPSEPLNIGDV